MPKTKMPKKPVPKNVVTVGEMKDLVARYPEFRFRVPTEEESTLTQLPGELAIPLDHFAAGLTLPLQNFLVVFFCYFKLLPAMLTPNSVTILIALYTLFGERKVSWSVNNIMAMLTVVTKEKGVMFAQVRHSKTFGLTGYPNAYHGWRYRFVWVKKLEGSWPMETVVDDVDSAVFKGWEKTKDIANLYKEIGSSYFVLDVISGAIDTSRSKRKSDDDAVFTEEVAIPSHQLAGKKRKVTASDIPPAEIQEISGDSDGGENEAGPSTAAGAEDEVPEDVPLVRKGKEAAVEEEAPVDSAEDDFWFDDEAQLFTSKYNASFNYIPDCLVSDLPDAILDAQYSDVIRRDLHSRREDQIIKLQSHLAFSSAMVGKYLGEVAESRKETIEKSVQCLKRVREQRDEYRRRITNLRGSASEAADKFKADEAALRAQVEALTTSRDQAAAALDSEKLALASVTSTMHSQENHFAEEQARWNAEKATMAAEIADLKLKLEAAAAASNASVASEEALALLRSEVSSLSKKIADDQAAASDLVTQAQVAAVAAYKDSDEFLGDMGDYQRTAMDILKDALVKDGKIARDAVSLYSYEDCMERDCAGEFL